MINNNLLTFKLVISKTCWPISNGAWNIIHNFLLILVQHSLFPSHAYNMIYMHVATQHKTTNSEVILLVYHLYLPPKGGNGDHLCPGKWGIEWETKYWLWDVANKSHISEALSSQIVWLNVVHGYQMCNVEVITFEIDNHYIICLEDEHHRVKDLFNLDQVFT